MTQENAIQQRQLTPVDRLKNVMEATSVQQQFKNALAEKSNIFTASLIDLYASDTTLQKCDPSLVVMEALKAATLDLPINKALGFAYVIPYQKSQKVNGKWEKKQVPQFQLGYKGMIQLAMRTGQYKYINAGSVLKGEFKGFSKLTGELDITGKSESDEVVGYFSHIETINGFKKTLYMSLADMQAHGEKYSKSYSYDSSPWKTEFNSMAEKTMLRMLLGKYGIMTVDMAQGIVMDKDPNQEEIEYLESANSELIDIVPENVNTETGEVTQDETPPTEAELAKLETEMDPY